MRFARLIVATAISAGALTLAPASHAATGPAVCHSASTASTSSTASDTRSTTLYSDTVAVDGASDVAVLCQYQYTPEYQPDTSFNVAYSRLCVGVNVCNGDSGWICVGVNVCNGNKPSRDICVGVNVCNKYYNSATMFPTNASFRAQQGQPIFLCSVVKWKDAAGNSFYSAYDANEQQPGTQCALS